MTRSAPNPGPRSNSGNPARECAIFPVEPPREPFGNFNMARRRGIQKGYLHKQGNMWYIAFREDALDEAGRIVRVRRNVRIGSAKEFSKREAQRIADEEILRRVNMHAQQPGSMLTLQAFVDTRFRPEVIKFKKHAGQLHYENMLTGHILPALGEKRLRDVTNDDVQRLVGLKVDAGLSPQTVLHIRNVIGKVFRHAKKRNLFYGDLPTEGVEMPEMIRREAHAMNFKSAVALLDGLAALSLNAFGMVLLSLTTSMNIAEILGLRWKRVNLAKGPVMLDSRKLDGETVAVRENYYRGVFGTVKKKARNRDLPLPQGVVAVLKKIMAESHFTGPDDLVFATEHGTTLDERNLMRRIIGPTAAPWMGWHVLRHTHSTLAEDIGMALSDRQAQMGHSDLRMTLRYTHSDLERRRQILDTMTDRLIGRLSDTRPAEAEILTLNRRERRL